MVIRVHPDFKRLLLICSAGLLLRLVFLPISETTEADAVSRVFAAQRWLMEPHFITHGVWGPLYTYLVALAMWIIPDAVIAPVLLNIVFAVATAIPLYFFTKNEFGERGAVFVAAAFVFYPLAVRNSLMALSEIPFMFFVWTTLYFVSTLRRGTNATRDAVLAGLSLTCAGALRYEAWVLIPLLAVILWRQPRALILFLIISSAFPILWMIGNAVYAGDPLHGATAARDWHINVEGTTEDLTLTSTIVRLVFYPVALLFGITPIVAALAAVGIVACLRQGNRCLHVRIWLVPLAGLFVFLLWQTMNGALIIRVRYSITVGMLALPFAAVPIAHLKSARLTRTCLVLIVLTMIPLSLLSRLPLIPTDTEAVPSLKSNRAHEVLAYFNSHPNDISSGLILDFFSWEDTYYLALMSRVHPDNILIMPGGKHEQLDTGTLTTFLAQHTAGVLVLDRNSRLAQESVFRDTNLYLSPLSPALQVTLSQEISSTAVFNYRVAQTPDN